MKKIVLALGLLWNALPAFSQDNQRVITTGVPFLMIASDARAAGMGDMGVATSTDVFSQQWNPSKYAFAIEKQGVSASFTPYLSELVNDISLGQLTYYNKINERSAFAGSFRFFSLGTIELRDNAVDDPRIVSPNEFAFDGSYSLKLSNKFSMGVAARYIRSNLRVASENIDASAASSFAVDVSGFYESEESAFESFNGKWRAGFNLQNIGPKISYDKDQFSTNFLPSNLKLGGGFDFILDDYNKVTLNLELNKLLVPTPQNPDINGDGTISAEERTTTLNNYRSISWASGIFKSFGDAPGGFSEELKEVTYALGAEYMYQDSFAFRTGYFNESDSKGARKYFTLGAGFKYSSIKVDVSYLFSASKIRNPLENTLRFSLSFNFGDSYTN